MGSTNVLSETQLNERLKFNSDKEIENELTGIREDILIVGNQRD